MNPGRGFLAAAVLLVCSLTARAAGPVGPVPGTLDTDRYRVSYVKLGAEDLEGLLFEPKNPGPNARFALVSIFPRTTLGTGQAEELANRGYRVLKVLPFAEHDSPYDAIPEASAAISYLRTLPGVQRVLIMGHSGGAHATAFYTNVALHGPAGCRYPDLVYPCDAKMVTGLAKPDGVLLLDPGIGPLNTALSVDPTYVDGKRTRLDLDMYAPANGYDPKTGAAKYSPDFLKRYQAAQSARAMQIIASAQARLKVIEQGKGDFAKDEPFAVPGMFNSANGPAPYQSDVSLLSHTKQPHPVLKPDGSIKQEIVRSVRPPVPPEREDQVGSLCCASIYNSLRGYLALEAIRTTKDFAVTADDLVGVEWKSAIGSPMASVEGITVPTLVFVNTCYRLVVTGEIYFNRLAAKDKTFVALEGASHNFNPCKPEYGDTEKRGYDYIANWISKPGRF